MRMVGDELRDHARAPEQGRDGLLPQFDRSPRPPQKSERAHEHVVARRHARQRAAVMLRESYRSARESVDVRSVELGAAVATEMMTIQRVEQHDDGGPRNHAAKLAGTL